LVKTKFHFGIVSLTLLAWIGAGCSPTSPAAGPAKVIAVENFLADVAQNIAGTRFAVRALIPYGIEPHEFDPTPKEMAAVAESQLLIVNGGGLEGWLAQGLKNIGGSRIVVTASDGLKSRTPETDPHFWFDPNLMKTYVQNMLAGFIQLDPAGEAEYRRNAAAYSADLDALDSWIRSEAGSLPAAGRILVTDHSDLGYFADRYGFTILGTINPGTSPDAEPSAAEIADLIRKMKAARVKAVFLEVGANTQLADQIAQETGCRVVAGLYTHSLTPPGGVASTYLEMIRYDVTAIVEASK
jgi:ABC-type Zn uptake system ZnuABC Zn-binding protein ZnuA